MTTQPRIHGRYRVDERLGATRIATVYRAYDDKLNRPVLLNLMRSHLVEQRSLRERFISDSELRARNVHSALPEVYDSGTIENRPFFITEFITGQTMRTRAPLSPLEALQYLRQIVGVVNACQQSHIPHPPISSNDFVVVSEGHVKWIENSTLTPNQSLIDIASYRAPERKEGMAETSTSAIYAIGVLFFEMMSGMRPFTSDTADEIAQLHEQNDIPPVSSILAEGCPPQIDELMMRCTARNPDYRLHDCDELLALIERVRRDLLIENTHTSAAFGRGNSDTTAASVYADDYPQQRSGIRRWVIGLLLVALLGGAGWLFGPQLLASPQISGLWQNLSNAGAGASSSKIIMPKWLDSIINGSTAVDAQTLQVTGDSQLQLHSDPDSQSTVVSQIPAGSRVIWLDGPRTADGTAWLHVQYTGSDTIVVDGWAPQNRLVAPTP
jgi:serine/threonine protein kinase